MKKSVLGTVKFVGGFNALSKSSWRRDRLLILGYHGLSLKDEHEWDPTLFMPPEMFRERLESMLEFGCSILPLSDAVRRQRDGTLPERAVAITFDDGFYNFFEAALPILKEFDVPASVYVTTYYSLKKWPVFPIAVGYLIWKARDKTCELEIENCVSGTFELSDEAVRASLHAKIHEFSLTEELSATEKNDLLKLLCGQLGLDFDDFGRERLFNLMTTDEIREVSDAGIGVELHTHRHRMPTEKSLFDREINDNRDVIFETTGILPSHFCYPSGNYDPMYFDWIAKNGVESATTCDTGLMERSTHLMQVPRLIDTASLSKIEFEGWLTGAAALIPKRELVRSLPAPALIKLVPIEQLEMLSIAGSF
ncbi:MAG: polysaccharide deacetylase family protein [Pyrinomonadaceae bacterium]